MDCFFYRMNDQDIINVLVIDPEKFISQVLDPKIQEIAKGKFYIVAYRTRGKFTFLYVQQALRPGTLGKKTILASEKLSDGH